MHRKMHPQTGMI